MSITQYRANPIPDQTLFTNPIGYYCKVEQQGGLVAFLALALKLVIFFFLAISLIGLPLLFAIREEIARQKIPAIVQAAFKENSKNIHQKNLEREDVFDKVSSYLTHDDLKSLAAASKGFNKIVTENTLIKEKNSWAKRHGFDSFSNEKTVEEHETLFQDLRHSWGFTPQLMQFLGGLFQIPKIPAWEYPIESLIDEWPAEGRSMIGVRDPVTGQSCLALHVVLKSDEAEDVSMVEIYQFEGRDTIRCRIPSEGAALVEIPPKIFYDRLRRLINGEPVGIIYKMLNQLFLTGGIDDFQQYADHSSIESNVRTTSTNQSIISLFSR